MPHPRAGAPGSRISQLTPGNSAPLGHNRNGSGVASPLVCGAGCSPGTSIGKEAQTAENHSREVPNKASIAVLQLHQHHEDALPTAI